MGVLRCGPTPECFYFGNETGGCVSLPCGGRSPLQGLPHQLFGAGLRGGEHALVVRSLADVTAEDLQDARYRQLTGQLGRVVRGPRVT